MAQTVVALKVKIGLKQVGSGAEYPDFNAILRAREPKIEMDWSHFVDLYGGWHYDKQCGHKESDETSPMGMQWGLLYVPRWFAESAVIRFPDVCSIMSEVESKDFHEVRAHGHEPEVLDNEVVLRGIAAKRAAGVPEDDDDRRALDPDDRTPGRKRNKRKLQSTYLESVGLTLE